MYCSFSVSCSCQFSLQKVLELKGKAKSKDIGKSSLGIRDSQETSTRKKCIPKVHFIREFIPCILIHKSDRDNR